MYKHFDSTIPDKVEWIQHVESRSGTEPEYSFSFVEDDVCLKKKRKILIKWQSDTISTIKVIQLRRTIIIIVALNYIIPNHL